MGSLTIGVSYSCGLIAHWGVECNALLCGNCLVGNSVHLWGPGIFLWGFTLL